MSNMDYCSFQNTAKDLEDCIDHWDDELSEDEEKAKEKIIKIFNNMAEDLE